jgi:malonyl-CoA/methylmalonyl-CoA synthetase
MVFAVPTMIRRIAAAAGASGEVAGAFADARLVVSGSAGLPASDHRRFEQATGQRVVERYGMTETLMNTSVRVDGERKPGSVGLPLPGVALRFADDGGSPVEPDDGAVAEIQVRGPNLFTGYLNQPDATAAAFVDGWFRTGDLATRDADGYVRILGRRSTDLIKSGGYRIGAGEVEAALLEHPAVAEVAVAGRPDEDLGERVVAWVVREPGAAVDAAELSRHTAAVLAPHKRPRDVHFLDELPRNAMGKVLKRELSDA